MPFSTADEQQWVEIVERETLKTFHPDDARFQMILRDAIRRVSGELPSSREVAEYIEEIKYLAYRNSLKRNLHIRVAYNLDGWICYDLDVTRRRAYKISAEGYEDIETPKKVFWQTPTYSPQVEPDRETEAEELPELVHKHFRLRTKEDELLFGIYLVTAFLKPLVNVPLLVLLGEKGSSKSSILRRIERIIDPKTTDLMGAPQNNSDLEIRLNNNYFSTFDNLSFLTKRTSDLLARAITGGSTSRRRLYTDATEITLKLRSIVALNGIDSCP